jgi:hypothetical protein
MPADNRFAHQEYTSKPPQAAYEMLQPALPLRVDCPEFAAPLARIAAELRAQKVAHVFLVHGTIVGTDTLGLMRELSRWMPEVSEYLCQQEKLLADTLLGDTANYSQGFAEEFERALASDEGPVIPVRRFLWSSENHHFGRAEAAVRLLAEIKALALATDERVLLWGHSHAGNVFALLSNLIGGTSKSVEAMYRAVRSVVGARLEREQESESQANAWGEVAALIDDGGLQHAVDLVTFGTPIRYGWESNGYGKLLHFVNHRPVTGLPVYRVPFPLSVEQMVSSECGDFLQQHFVAGTNFPPNVLAWRMWQVERKLGKLFERGKKKRRLWQRLLCGQRVPSEGDCLLVDYAASDPQNAAKLMGHGIYTRSDWLSFHLAEVARRFYGAKV